MLSIALALLITGVGVGFGWQPMPGNSSESELVVQLDPATLERFAEGATIPLAADVPPTAGRVARVRLVVGSGQPSQRREVTQYKPTTEPSGIVLTQFTSPEGPRYGMPPAGAPPTVQPIVAPPTVQPFVAPPTVQPFDPYTQAPPTAATASTWNSGAEAIADSANRSLQQVGSEIQTATQPLQDGVAAVGDSVQQMGQSIAGQAEQLRNQLGLPPQNGLFGSGTGQTVTPAATSGSPGAAAVWNGGPPTTTSTPQPSVPPPSVPPLAASSANVGTGGSNWNYEAPPTPSVGNTFGVGAGTTSPVQPYSGGTANTDRWANADDPRLRTGGAATTSTAVGAPGTQGGFGTSAPPTSGFGNTGGFGNASTFSNSGAGNAPSWGNGNSAPILQPPSLPPTGGTFGQGGPALGPANGSNANSGAPAVSAQMLDLASNRILEGSNGPTGTGIATQGVGAGASPPSLGGFPPATQPGTGSGTGGSLIGSQSWATGGANPATSTSTGANQPTGANSDGRQQAAVVLAWVLLFASVAGNMYLFWSYLDVRTKYRALVRKTARAVGSRFSAA